MEIYQLIEKIQKKEAKIGLVGVGYVGSALGIGAATKGFDVIGYGRSEESIEKIRRLSIPRFAATTRFEDLSACDVICVCVPTPVHEDKTPDLEPLSQALLKTSQILRSGMLVVIESSIAPGTTRKFALPILERTGLKAESDFFLGYSPERIDPGNNQYIFSNIPKVVAGLGPDSRQVTYEFYKQIVDEVHPVSSLEAAEMSKILENTFRLVNISLVNEIADYTKEIGVDIWEVIDAASTKPFGFLKHYPGPGIGGHCIAVDPYYLLRDSSEHGIPLKILNQATRVNEIQPLKVVHQARQILNEINPKKKEYKVLLVGVTYKPDVSDTRESPALAIWELLKEVGVDVSYHDPFVPAINGKESLSSLDRRVKQFDLIIITTKHTNIDYQFLAGYRVPILDTQNALKMKGSHIFNLFTRRMSPIEDDVLASVYLENEARIHEANTI